MRQAAVTREAARPKADLDPTPSDGAGHAMSKNLWKSSRRRRADDRDGLPGDRHGAGRRLGENRGARESSSARGRKSLASRVVGRIGPPAGRRTIVGQPEIIRRNLASHRGRPGPPAPCRRRGFDWAGRRSDGHHRRAGARPSRGSPGSRPSRISHCPSSRQRAPVSPPTESANRPFSIFPRQPAKTPRQNPGLKTAKNRHELKRLRPRPAHPNRSGDSRTTMKPTILNRRLAVSPWSSCWW